MFKCLKCGKEVPERRIKRSFRCRNCNTWYKSNIETAIAAATISFSAAYGAIMFYSWGWYLGESDQLTTLRFLGLPIAAGVALIFYRIVYRIREK